MFVLLQDKTLDIAKQVNAQLERDRKKNKPLRVDLPTFEAATWPVTPIDKDSKSWKKIVRTYIKYNYEDLIDQFELQFEQTMLDMKAGKKNTNEYEDL